MTEKRTNVGALAEHHHPPLVGDNILQLGDYGRSHIGNVQDDLSRDLFNAGLRHLLSYHHEEAAKYFISCTRYSPYCALAHAMVALCHGPNYNFNQKNYYFVSDPEYDSSVGGVADTIMTRINHDGDISPLGQDVQNRYQHGNNAASSPENSLIDEEDSHLYPSQHLALYHASLAVSKANELQKQFEQKIKKSGYLKSLTKDQTSTPSSSEFRDQPGHNNSNHNNNRTTSSFQPTMISDLETQLINAIYKLSAHPGIAAELAEETVGRPYADAMGEIYKKYPHDPEVACFYAEGLMILNAWNLYEYPSGKALSEDVAVVRDVLESSLELHPTHAGLCHLYVHLSEMSLQPEKALPACDVLRTHFPDAGHLVHMPTHIDAILGNYEDCVRYNQHAIEADTKAMSLNAAAARTSSFYFGYVVHNYHMLVYGAIIGAMEEKAMECAMELNSYLTEDAFVENPDLTWYLEGYATMDVHILVRFGRWKQILDLPLPNDPKLMLYRAASLRYARALALANTGDTTGAREEAKEYERIKAHPEAADRNLHNNTIADLLDVDSFMIKGEILYFEGEYEEAFQHLRKAIELQDTLNYDEPWGKMQPIRHALGGLLLNQGRIEESISVYRADLKRLPNNPWSLIGLIRCLKEMLRRQQQSSALSLEEKTTEVNHVEEELKELQYAFDKQRSSEWTDFNVTHSCACCHGDSQKPSCCCSSMEL